MSELATLQNCIDIINRNSPAYALNAVTPDVILRRRAANCFGRASLIGSALLAQGTPETDMHLLIAHNHGMEAKPDKHWMGHAALALPELGMILEAYADGTHLRQLSETSWPPSQDNVVIDHCQLQRLEKLRQSLRPQDIKEAESFWGPPHIYDKHHLLNAYSLTDGIARYQASLPSLAQEASYTVDDYAACYAKLVIAQIE